MNDEAFTIVVAISRLAFRLDQLCEADGPLQPGYCDECGGKDCRDWQCQAVRSAIPYDIQSATHEGWEFPPLTSKEADTIRKLVTPEGLVDL